jgi:Family of unknown function (DUF5654)
MSRKNLSSTPSFQYYPQECSKCQNRKDPQYVFNSTILTIFMGSLAFLTSLAINTYVKESFEHMTSKKDELQAKFNYAVIVSFSAIVVGFLLMYNLNGTKY